MSDPIPRNDPYYPWQIELFDWLKAEEAARRSSGAGPEDPSTALQKPKSRMSDLLRFASMARQQPEIWERVVRLADRLKSGKGRFEEEQKDLGTFCGQFAAWFRMKNNIDDVYISFALTTTLLVKFASGELDEQDEEGIRAHYRGPFTTEDE